MYSLYTRLTSIYKNIIIIYMGKILKFSQISPAGITILVLLVAVLGVLISTGILKNKESFYSEIFNKYISNKYTGNK